MTSGARWCGCGVMLLLAVAMGGCSTVQDLLGGQTPTASLAGINLQDVGLSAATMMFDIDINNPYPTALPLVNLDYQLASAGAAFMNGKAALQGDVPARGSKRISLPARISYADLLTALKGVRPGMVVPYQAELGLSVDAPALGAMRLPLKKSGQLPVPAAPDIRSADIKWDKLSLDEGRGVLRVQAVNNNQFDMQLSQLTYNLALAGVAVTKSSLSQSTAFAASGGAGTIEVPISFSPAKLGQAAFQLLSGQGAGYQLQGDMSVNTPFGPMTLPLRGAGTAGAGK